MGQYDRLWMRTERLLRILDQRVPPGCAAEAEAGRLRLIANEVALIVDAAKTHIPDILDKIAAHQARRQAEGD